jgi:hypothetical protein
MKRFIASFVKGQVVLLTPQPILLGLILFKVVSLYYSAPVVIGLAVLSSWFDYAGKAQRRGASVLRKLERLVDDFGDLNFQKPAGTSDERIVRFLDKAVFPLNGSINPELASAGSDRIKDLYFALELWYFSLRQKVRLLLRRTSTIVEHDLLEVVNEFTDFYTEFVKKIAEGTLRLISQGDMSGLESDRESFSIFKTRLSELRGRTNAFLQAVHDDGLPIPDTNIIALESDPWLGSARESSEPQPSSE